MYAVASGTDGVLRAIQLLREEIETTMRLLGVSKPMDRKVARTTWLPRRFSADHLSIPLLVKNMLTLLPLGQRAPPIQSKLSQLHNLGARAA